MKPFLTHDECMGCKACGDICPVGAISFPVDEEGFWQMTIDEEKCIDCHRCEMVCPVKNYPESRTETNRSEPLVYKSWHKDPAIRYNSTSGGMYYAAAEAFLERGGVLVGSVYTEKFERAIHVAVKDHAGLQRVMRSKYFQSDTEGIYKVVRDLLKKGEKVLFCGAPCQSAALHKFIGAKDTNLFTMDFVCRGINSPLAYSSYMDELKARYKSELKEVRFKDKSRGWTNLGTRIFFQNGKEYYRNRYNDPWVNGFIAGNLYMRPACFQCAFKKLPRVSDMSIGDFWGLNFTQEESSQGVSLVFSNNEKGDWLLDISRPRMFVEHRTLEEALQGNPAILHSAVYSEKRKQFFALLRTVGFSDAVWRTMGSTARERWLKEKNHQIKVLLSRFSILYRIKTMIKGGLR